MEENKIGLTAEEQQEYTELMNLEANWEWKELSEEQKQRLEELKGRLWKVLWDAKEQESVAENVVDGAEKPYPENAWENVQDAWDESEKTPEQEMEGYKKEMEKLMKKITELKAKYLDLFKELENYRTKYLDLLGEFENYRNRTDKEKEQMLETGAKKVLKNILPIIDNFERGLANVKPEEENDPHVEGMRVIYNQFMTELEKLGVKPIETVGCKFDSDFHTAVMLVPSDKYEPGFIAQEVQKWYMYKDSVLRHSSVGVVPEA